MDTPKHAKRVGLFVLACLILLAVLVINFSKGVSFFTPIYELYLRTSNAGGIKRGANVLIAGVPVGSVAGADLAPDGKSVILRLKLLQRYSVRQDALFVIEQSGFLGDQYVAIYPRSNTGSLLQSGALVTCQEPFNMQEVARNAAGFIQRIDETAKRLNEAIQDVRKHLLNEETLTNLAVTASNLRLASARAVTTVDSLEQLVVTNTAPVGISLSNVVRFTEQLNQMAADLNQTILTNQSQLTAAMKNFENATVLVNDLLADLRAGKGLAGGLLKDEQLKHEMSLLMTNLLSFSAKLDRNGILFYRSGTKTNWQRQPASSIYPGKDPRR